MSASPEIDLRALDLLERLLSYPGHARFRQRLLRRECPEVLARLAQLEAGHQSRAALPTTLPTTLPMTGQPGLAASARHAPPPGQIGPFRLTGRIGQGGMGDVWRAERADGLFDQVVAIKFIHASLDATAGAAFQAERRILAKLDHPDIVRLIDGGVTQDGLPYLIMDFVTGQPFDAAVAPLPLPQRIRLFRKVLDAVQFAHGKLIAHADLKPSNVMVDAQGRVRLLDFGIAELLTADRTQARPAGAMTAAFASPQRLAGAPPSIADDVFALGVLLRIITAGRPEGSFPTTSPGATPRAESGTTPRAAPGTPPRAESGTTPRAAPGTPPRAAPGTPPRAAPGDPDLAAIIARATAPTEDARYLTVAGFAADLASWQSGHPVTARPATPAYLTRKFVARNKRPVLAASLAILALVATTAAATIASIRAEHARAEAAARFDDARGTARYLLFTLFDRLEALPNTLTLRNEAAGVAQLYLDRLAHAPNAPPDMQIETASGFIRLAESQGVPSHPNLDNGALALANLQHAIQLLGPAPTGPAALLAIRARIEASHVQDYINNNADAALPLLDGAAAIAARTPNLPRLLAAQFHVERADVYSWKENYDASIADARAALALLGEAPQSPAEDTDSLIARASAIEDIAFAEGARGHTADSLAGYRRQIALYEAAYQQNPSSRRLRRQLARARWMYGAADPDHPTPDALAQLTTAAAELRAVAAFDADDADTPRLADYADADRARMLAWLGQLDAGLAVIHANLAVETTQAARHPTELQWLRDHIIDQGMLGDMLAAGGRTAEGCAVFAQFRAEVAALARRGDIANMSLGEAMKGEAVSAAKYCGK